jgi:hypothetical protein
MENGFWAREERDELRLAARALGVNVELHLLERQSPSSGDDWRFATSSPFPAILRSGVRTSRSWR